MTRRQFHVSLGALGSSAMLPVTAAQSAALPAVSPSTYKWAQLIVRAQEKADPAMLARLLRLSPEMAQGLFDKLIRDGALRARGAAGIMQAMQPVQIKGHSTTSTPAARCKLRAAWNNMTEDAQPLVNRDNPALGCGNTPEKETPDASAAEPLQESPRRG